MMPIDDCSEVFNFRKTQLEEANKITRNFYKLEEAMKKYGSLYSKKLEELKNHLIHPLLIRDVKSESEFKKALQSRIDSNETKLLKRELNVMINRHLIIKTLKKSIIE